MADTKISALTIDTAPDNGADYVPTYDASAVATKRVLLQNLGAYAISTWLGAALSPADSTSYVIGPHPNVGLATTFTNHRTYIPRTGKLIAAYASILVAGTLATTENSTLAFRLNDTTDTTVSSVVQFNAVHTDYSNTALGVAVTAGGFFAGKLTTPAWVTNPTSVSVAVEWWFI